ncbi:t-SNARE affecting a late Golgi compartment protein 1 [[Candida] jaroonii]|uniref:t-SNARE affecting a late Golgi compartment protein 1 n=1 Tax=[Candida] jaroonii TaxID=467808 RepID=A0ACA9YCF7_9ASCO|nr:t-SNARE affecting a late Golgi compartment protein 1 [[Candida] jaroonii]
MSSDPFNEVEEDAWQQLKKLEGLGASEFVNENLKLDFNNVYQELEEIMNDLNEALNISKESPAQFNLTNEDISKRYDILNKLEDKKQSIMKSWNSKINDPRRIREVTSMSNRISQDGENPFNDKHRIDNEFNQYQQQELIKDQDLQLDSIHETMRNLNQQAMIMGNELEDQGMMLDDLDHNLDRVDNRLQQGLKRINWVIEKNRERGSDWCIGILVVALIVLLILIIIA